MLRDTANHVSVSSRSDRTTLGQASSPFVSEISSMVEAFRPGTLGFRSERPRFRLTGKDPKGRDLTAPRAYAPHRVVVRAAPGARRCGWEAPAPTAQVTGASRLSHALEHEHRRTAPCHPSDAQREMRPQSKTVADKRREHPSQTPVRPTLVRESRRPLRAPLCAMPSGTPLQSRSPKPR